MNNLKDVFNKYEENPSADLWERLNARLDEEMPVTGSVSRLQRVKVWKWVAAALTVLVLGGAVSFGVFLQHRDNHDVISKNIAESADNELIKSSEAVIGQDAILESDVTVAEVKTEDALQPRYIEVNIAKEQNVQSAKQEEAIAPKTNVRQVVLPPNSTLAKQLAADPVLKNLSDDSVDWSLPVHLSIPNLFTPNNDGVNDLFVIEGLENYASPRLVVRDKNNKVVYQNNTYKNTWGGEDCPEGVYSYEFTFVYNGIENQATGKVRIIRA